MRASGEQLKSMSTEGRFDEASQRDVLELAARLQKMHLETMSASEIEAAAVEGGMDAAFVREAIRRVSTSAVAKTGELEEEGQTASSGEWMVAIFVPLLVFGILFLRNLADHGNLNLAKAVVIVAGFAFLGALLLLSVVGVRALMGLSTPITANYQVRSLPKTRESMSLGAIVLYCLIGLTLATIPFSQNGTPLTQFFFLAVLMPVLGVLSKDLRSSFWKAFGVGVVGSILSWLLNLSQGAHDELAIWPILITFSGCFYGALSLAGHGIKRLFTKESRPPSRVDRTEMLTQLFELQAALDRHQETRAFLSVDVVGSSTMKSSASELEAEYSFRQYQAWVAETVRGFGGEVQLSAGDGAMAMFKDASHAVAAGKQLQLGVQEFNSTKNRLPDPFRLRCGIAEGKIGIDAGTALGQIQSPVLDRAAFLQKYAEPGSVVVSKELIEAAMPVLGSLHQRELIDGKAVYSWP